MLLYLQSLHLLCMEKYKKVIHLNNKFKISAPTWNEELKLPK